MIAVLTPHPLEVVKTMRCWVEAMTLALDGEHILQEASALSGMGRGSICRMFEIVVLPRISILLRS